MGKVLLIALFVFLNFLSIWALPSGPPPAACRNLNPQGHVGSSQNLGFQLVARDGTTFAPGGPSIVGEFYCLFSFVSSCVLNAAAQISVGLAIKKMLPAGSIPEQARTQVRLFPLYVTTVH